MSNTTLLHNIALVLLIIGGLNWGLVGLFKFDLVAAVFGGLPYLARAIYVLVGLSAAYIAVTALNTVSATAG